MIELARSETWGDGRSGNAVYDGWALEIRLLGLLIRLVIERKQ